LTYQTVCPHYTFFDMECLAFFPILRNLVSFIGLAQLVLHRFILEKINLIPAPLPDLNYDEKKSKMTCPIKLRSHYSKESVLNLEEVDFLCTAQDDDSNVHYRNHDESKKKINQLLKFRPDDGMGTDFKNPSAASTGSAIGRNMPAIPKHMRNLMGSPEIQLVAQRLLAREGFVAAGSQLNIMAAAWIQAQIHGWVGHIDGKKIKLESKSGISCPMHIFETLERPDGHYDSERSQWWDVSFLYGQTVAQVKESRSFKGGKLKVNTMQPNTIASREDGTYFVGDNKNSWVGVDLIKELFLKEHNYICDKLAENYNLTDDSELFGYARNIVAAINAKIHTIDWTCELLKTNQLEVGMRTNWYGMTKAIFGKKAPGHPLRVIQKKKAENHGVPFSLTEEFVAVYRLHPLCPPGIILEYSEDPNSSDEEFVPLSNLLGTQGRKFMRRSKDLPFAVMKSMLSYPCGALVGSNYPEALRAMSPTDSEGVEFDMEVDLAVIDLYRDRERGIPSFNEFRRQLHLKPYKTWEEMTGNAKTARKLELMYGEAPDGIEKCDLLVGDLYEKKLNGFAISETSFIIFLLMSSRRLDSDPFLNEFFDEDHYTKFGLEHIDATEGFLDVLKRHYPTIAAPFEAKQQSAFKPLYDATKWDEAIKSGVVNEDIVNKWEDTRIKNEAYFRKLENDEGFINDIPHHKSQLNLP